MWTASSQTWIAIPALALARATQLASYSTSLSFGFLGCQVKIKPIPLQHKENTKPALQCPCKETMLGYEPGAKHNTQLPAAIE